MRDPTVRATAAAEEERAVETAKEHLYWNLKGCWRWEDSRWSGQSPKDEREQEYRYAMEAVRKKINQVPDPVERKYLTTWHERVPSRPRLQEKGVLREQTNALRNPYIADTVALVRRKHGFNVKQACSAVAKALRELDLAPRSEKSVVTIWNKYRRLLSGK